MRGQQQLIGLVRGAVTWDILSITFISTCQRFIPDYGARGYVGLVIPANAPVKRAGKKGARNLEIRYCMRNR